MYIICAAPPEYTSYAQPKIDTLILSCVLSPRIKSVNKKFNYTTKRIIIIFETKNKRKKKCKRICVYNNIYAINIYKYFMKVDYSHYIS